ncbi:MAG: response regulator [Alphaproteobacteria bacterium]|nr:response regulator [Alphaproteobacteria bacterium]
MSKIKHIVIEEASKPLRHLIVMALNYPGHHQITEVENHTEALSVLRAYKPNLLIIEYESNGVSGLDHVRQIRNGKAGCKRNIPIIVLTDPKKEEWMEAYMASQVMEAGANACVSKPLSIRKLFPVAVHVMKQAHEERVAKLHIVAPFGFSRFMEEKVPRLMRFFAPPVKDLS